MREHSRSICLLEVDRKQMIEVKQICIGVIKMDCEIADYKMERGETRSVLTNWSKTTELTNQPVREEVRTIHARQHLNH